MKSLIPKVVYFIIFNIEKNAPPPPKKKKKKKKEPPFIVPEWASDLNVLQSKVAELKGYVAEFKDIGLNKSNICNLLIVLTLIEGSKWLPFNGMLPFEQFTHILTSITCPPRLSLYSSFKPTISDICRMANPAVPAKA